MLFFLFILKNECDQPRELHEIASTQTMHLVPFPSFLPKETDVGQATYKPYNT